MRSSHIAGLESAIAVINGKGGTLKTSCTAALGGLIAATGDWRVLLVDLDSQGNLTEDLGLADHTDEGAQLVEAIAFERPLVPRPTGREGLSVVYGGERLEDLAGVISARQSSDPEGWAHLLADVLDPVADDFDLVLFDCPPGEAPIQTLALVAARYMVIPARSDGSSRKGLRRVAARVGSVRARNPELELLGVVMTGVGTSSTAVRREAREEIEADLGGAAPVFEATIRHVESAAKIARDRGQLPHELEERAASEKGYWQRVREALAAEGGEGKGGTGKHRAERPKVARSLPGTTSGLAQDYAELAQEVLDALGRAQDRRETTGQEVS